MKKGTKIQITNSARNLGQSMNWTETFTGIKVIGVGGEVVTHISDREIKKFAPKQICVHPQEHSESFFTSNISKAELNGYIIEKYIYSIFLPEGTEVETYSNDEYRFELLPLHSVIFSGKTFECKGKQIESKLTGYMMDTYLRYSDTITMIPFHKNTKQ